MRKQIYQNQIWAQHYPQVTRFKVLLSEEDEETREEDRRGLMGIDWERREGRGGVGMWTVRRITEKKPTAKLTENSGGT